MSETTPFMQHAGVFSIGTHAPGAPTLQALLTVPPKSSIVSGHGKLTQATNPPLNIASNFHGVVHALGVGPAKQVFAVQGSPIPPGLIGTPVITNLFIVLDGIWGNKGTASYSYWIGSKFEEISDVPVTVQWLLQG
jgi:hypothetical protein